MSNTIRTVIVNYQTPDLLKISADSFRKFYPSSPLLIIDNGSKDHSREIIEDFRSLAPDATDVLLLESNTYHGPALHRAMSEVKEDLILFLDSDTETMKEGFLELMEAEFEKSFNVYGVGRIITVNKRGFPADTGIQVLSTAYMMLRRQLYFLLPPFEHHGQPSLKNFIAAQKKEYLLKSFPIENYVEHRWRGTASRFGYGLGWKGKRDFVLNKIGI